MRPFAEVVFEIMSVPGMWDHMAASHARALNNPCFSFPALELLKVVERAEIEI